MYGRALRSFEIFACFREEDYMVGNKRLAAKRITRPIRPTLRPHVDGMIV